MTYGSSVMVGPSMTDDERTIAGRNLKIGFVALVSASGGLTALQAGGGIAIIAAGLIGGLALGSALLWFLIQWWQSLFSRAERRDTRRS
jgi:hypothetical protein